MPCSAPFTTCTTTFYLHYPSTRGISVWSIRNRATIDITQSSSANLDHRPGRTWRSLRDTADAAQILYYSPSDWTSQRRSVDYYEEGELIWLEADTIIRELSGDKRSLDNFARAFYGFDNGSFAVKAYTFEDVVKALNAIQPYDRARFFHTRIETHDASAPLGGLTRGGWSVAYSDQASGYSKARGKLRKFCDLRYSLGMLVSTAAADNGRIIDVIWGGPAFTAGLAPGMTVIALNGRTWDADLVDDVLRASQKESKPIEILTQNIDAVTTHAIDYTGGPRYPHLTRMAGVPDRLGEIIAAKAAPP